MIRKFTTLITIFSLGNGMRHVTFFVPLFLLGYCILAGRMKIMDIVMMFLGIITYITSKDETLIFTIFVILAVGDVSPKMLIRFWLFIQTAVLAGCTAAYIILYASGSELARAGVMDGRFRYYFLFNHPNNYAIQLFFCILGFVYLYAEKASRWKTVLILLLFAAFFYQFPKSMTATVATLVLILLLVATWYLKRYLKYIYGGLIAAIWFVVYVCVLALYFGRGQFVSILFGKAETFYERLSNAAELLQLFPVKLFGREMTSYIGQVIRVNGEWRALWMDLAYIRCFMTCGLLLGLLFSILLFRSFILCIRDKEYWEALVLAMICIYAMSEWSSFSITTAWGLVFLRRGLARGGPFFVLRRGREDYEFRNRQRADGS